MNLEREQRKKRVAWLSVASNTVLVILKVVVGLAIGSISVISEAIHSGMDLVAAIIACYAVNHSGRPADKQHPYGHGKIENISGVIEALLIFVAAGWIIFEAVKKLIHPEPLDTTTWGIVVMGVSAVVNIIVSKMLFKVGKETDSIALQADAWHLKTDVWTSLGVMAGLGLILLGKVFLPDQNLNWLDPVAAMSVALLIIKAAWDLTAQSFHDLLDVSLPQEDIDLVRQVINDYKPEIRDFHALRTRKSGHNKFVEVHVLVDASMSVESSHALTDKIVESIRSKIEGIRVLVHVEPDPDSHLSSKPTANEMD